MLKDIATSYQTGLRRPLEKWRENNHAGCQCQSRQRFFIDLIIRDISLEDAMLDLIDNAIDALVRTKQIDLYKVLLIEKMEHKTSLWLKSRSASQPNNSELMTIVRGIPFGER